MLKNNIKPRDIAVIAAAFIAIVVCVAVIISSLASRSAISAEAVSPALTRAAAETPSAAPRSTVQPPELTVSPEDGNHEHALALMEAMTTTEKIWQLFLVSPESVSGVGPVTISGEAMTAGLAAYPAGGLVYGAANARDDAQLQDMLLSVQELSSTALFITAAYDIGDSEVAVSGHMSSLGFNLSFGQTEKKLAAALPFADDMATENVAAIIASAALIAPEAGSSEDSSPEENSEGDSEESNEAVEIPCFMSTEYVAQLRQSLDWDGIVVTDFLTGGIEGYNDGELAVGAILAGCDMIAAPDDPIGAAQAISDALARGEISRARLNECVQRILYAKLDAGIISLEAEE